MKKPIVILFLFVFVIGLAQIIKLNNNTVSISSTGVITCDSIIIDGATKYFGVITIQEGDGFSLPDQIVFY